MHQNLLRADPRALQIVALSGLLVVGIGWLDFSIRPHIAATIIATALLVQGLIPNGRRGLASALISGLSLCLLLRTGSWSLAVAAAVIAIGSKHWLKFDQQHVFNPTALALVVITGLADGAWISPGQWGQAAYLLILIAGVGAAVSGRASRLDLSAAFLVCFAALCTARAVYLGDPADIPLHQLGSGALLIFTFFMLSDPRTTPASRSGRLLFALAVASLSAIIEFVLFRANGAVHALVLCAPLVPLLNRLLPGPAHVWPGKPAAVFLHYGARHV